VGYMCVNIRECANNVGFASTMVLGSGNTHVQL
jgi:hypothetical protein